MDIWHSHYTRTTLDNLDSPVGSPYGRVRVLVVLWRAVMRLVGLVVFIELKAVYLYDSETFYTWETFMISVPSHSPL